MNAEGIRNNSDETPESKNNTEKVSGDEFLEVKTEMLSDRILRYDRDFLLQFEQDKGVSTMPITLPVIPDIFPNKSTKTKYKHCRDKESRQKIIEHDMERETFDDTEDTSFSGRHSSSTESENQGPADTFEYNDTCYIVVDFDGINDDSIEDNKTPIETLPSNTGALSEYESEGNDKDKKAKEHYMTSDHRKDRKRYSETNNAKLESHHKRRRSSSHGHDESDRIKSSSNSRSHNFSYRHKRNASIRKQKRFIDRHYEKSPGYKSKVDLHDAFQSMSHYRCEVVGEKRITQGQGSYKGKEDVNNKQSEHIRPILYENGVCIKPESDDARNEVQDLQLSPVSERALSPYADFTGFFNNEEKHTNGLKTERNCLNEVKYLQNKETEIGSTRNEQCENGNNLTTGQNPPTNYENNNFLKNAPIPYSVTPYGYNNIQQAYCRMPFQTQPVFQYRNPAPIYPVPNAYCVSPFVPNIQDPNRSNSYSNFKGRGQQNQNNIVIKEPTSVQCGKNEYYWISPETVDSLPLKVKKKIVSTVYRVMVEGEDLEFSPVNILSMMKQSSPVKVGFATEDTLLDLLKRNEDKFLFQKRTHMISPKTNINLCPTFTNNPYSKHECMDLHICKYHLLGCCTVEKCKFSHKLNSNHNVKVLKSYDLWKIDERHIKRLLQNLNNRNISTTPLVCKFYNNEGGCQKGEFCMHLHVCTHFINDDCMFQSKCKRLHDLNNQQVRNVLEKHGIFPEKSNFDKIRNLIKATLADGGVKLKRELSTYQKSKEEKVINSKTINHCSTLPKIRSSGTYENSKLSKDIRINSKNKNIDMQDTGSICSDKLPQKPKDTIQSKGSEFEMSSLPDFISLDTSENDVVMSSCSKTNVSESSMKGVIGTSGDDLELMENMSENDQFRITDTSSSNRTKIKTSSSGKPILPKWKSLNHRTEDNTVVDTNKITDKDSIEKAIDDIIQSEADSDKESVESKQKNNNSNLNMNSDEEKTDETNNLQQLDIKIIESTNGNTEYCKLVDNELQTNPMTQCKASLDIKFEITSGTAGGYRVRKNGDSWQMQVKTKIGTDNEVTDVHGEQIWKNMQEDESERLNNIYSIFNDVIETIENKKLYGEKDIALYSDEKL
ncbi:uncharacterized protein LOC132746876 isoform X2 [Ruditapes philippinarum]|uniref:uncharacterized protein LOC132746876 isoform X2 n=1 Tax=Ruditapes philippinarum TaxID=129788 RepID=UPI00295B6706|nr:uncharacterized protein LOC132746876 isoform X2 [Ruditapes philippinarum]